MADNKWHVQTMEEGANQVLPLSATLAALILVEVLQLLDNAIAQATRCCRDTS